MARRGYIVVTLRIGREEGQWVGECPELGTATCADSLEEAFERLREAILLHLNTLEEVGECHRFLEENDIKFYRARPREATISQPALLEENVFINERVVPVAC